MLLDFFQINATISAIDSANNQAEPGTVIQCHNY